MTPSAEHAEIDPLALADFLDANGIGHGPVRASRIGEGASNLTYLVERDRTRVVLRRPPPPPLPPSAHDVVREAQIKIPLASTGARVPRVLAICEDQTVLGVPFYVMEEIEGVVVGETLPRRIDTPDGRRALGHEVVDALVELHQVDWRHPDLASIGRPSGYLERQLRRWRQLWEHNATRPLPLFREVADRLERAKPTGSGTSIVHGDYRLGNLMVAPDPPARVLALLDWEMATLGDPLADLGYLLATWSEPGVDAHPLLLSPVTERPGFPTRSELAERYSARTGADLSSLDWYEALALWKAAVFCEAIFARFLAGERDDAFASGLREGVPRLVELAADRV